MKFTVFLFFLFITSSLGGIAEEYKLKAAFIERFSRFIEWEQSNSDTILFGIVGNDIASDEFLDYFKLHSIKDRKVQIVPVEELSIITIVSILFIADESQWSVQEICDSVGDNTLIIGNDPIMAEQGAVISFVKDNNRLRFRVNPENADSQNITISSYLLELAEIVTSSNAIGGEQ